MGVTAYIGLGANLGEPGRALDEALVRLGALPETRLLAASPRYVTSPVGPPGQPDYLNAAACIETELTPAALLEGVKAIERTMGRTPGERWGPRVIDLDILIYGDLVLATADLELPHRELGRRRFALRPLFDLAPDLAVPGRGATVRALLAALDDDPADVRPA